MTYIYYIRKNNMRDSKDAYTSYLKEHDSSTKSMTAPMLEQYVNATYRLRFINHAWC